MHIVHVRGLMHQVPARQPGQPHAVKRHDAASVASLVVRFCWNIRLAVLKFVSLFCHPRAGGCQEIRVCWTMRPPPSRGQALRGLALMLRACEGIVDWLDQRSASFETAAARLPQDEEFS